MIECDNLHRAYVACYDTLADQARPSSQPALKSESGRKRQEDGEAHNLHNHELGTWPELAEACQNGGGPCNKPEARRAITIHQMRAAFKSQQTIHKQRGRYSSTQVVCEAVDERWAVKAKRKQLNLCRLVPIAPIDVSLLSIDEV